MRVILMNLAVAVLLFSSVGAQSEPLATNHKALLDSVRGHMEFLASDALRGRGSATHDELVAATYAASHLRRAGIEPAGDSGGYLQTVQLIRPELAGPPTVRIDAAGASVRWAHGAEMLVLRMGQQRTAGPLHKIDAKLGARREAAVSPGAVVLLNPGNEAASQAVSLQSLRLIQRGAAAVLFRETPDVRQRWATTGAQLPKMGVQIQGIDSGGDVVRATVAALSQPAFDSAWALADGTNVTFEALLKPATPSSTWNVLGKIPGADPQVADQAILLSAHLDHLGIKPAEDGDNIYNGADDDASGVIAVLELARMLGAGARPRRTLLFALFGSEETGGMGSTYFRERPPVRLEAIVANLQFEMIGRPDAAVAVNTLWLTGYERSTLGPELSAHGAPLVADPHPRENFFQRSDNYTLARRGVVAHTVSSFGLHEQYHRPDDDISKIDFAHMARAIDAMTKPILWLANSDFRPQWHEGKRP